MKVLSPIARKRYAQAGASVDEATQVVCIDRGLVAKALATTPSEFTFQALDPEFNVKVGGKHVCLAPTSGPPNIMDIHNGRRAGTFEDFCNLMKLSQSFDVIHTLGGAVEPQDVPVHAASLRDDAVDAAALWQDAVHFLARLAADRGLLRTDPHRPPGQRRRVQATPVRVDRNQHELAAAARHSDGRRHHRFRRGGAGADHHAVHAGRGDGAGHDHGRADACACRGTRRHHARAERAAGHADPLRQLHVERRHEVGFAGVSARPSMPRPRSAQVSSRATSRCRGVRRARQPRTRPTRRPPTRRR